MSGLTPPIRSVRSGRGHYYVDANGVRADGVTEVCKALPAPALLPWGINSVADFAINNWDELADQPPTARLKTLKGAPYAERDRASHRGVEVHRLADILASGERVDVPDELTGHVEGCVAFLDDWQPEPVLTETLVYSLRHGYAGRLDAVLDIGRLGRVIADYKTGKAIYPDVAPQLNAYAHAEFHLDQTDDPQPMVAVDGAVAIHLRSDGYDVYPVEISARAFRLWLYAQQIHHWSGTKGNPGWSAQVIGDPLRRPEVAA